MPASVAARLRGPVVPMNEHSLEDGSTDPFIWGEEESE